LNFEKVLLAEQVQYDRVRNAQQIVREKCETDAEFAEDVLKAVGDALPLEIKATCEKTIADRAKAAESSSESKTIAEA
jgi:hypothetical protein